MKKYKQKVFSFFFLLGMVVCLSIHPVIISAATNAGLFILKGESKLFISDILIIKEDTKIYYEYMAEGGRVECKIDDVPYDISYSNPAEFRIKVENFETTYHTLRFVLYDKNNKYVGKKQYLLKVIQNKTFPPRSHRKTKDFKVGQKPEYKKDYIPILMYHDITQQVTNESAQVSVSQLRRQIKTLLEAGYTPINFADYVAYKEGSKGLPKRPIIITFDDGYKSNYTNAYPVLKDLNVEATYFVTTSVMGKQTTANEHFSWAEAKEMEKSGLIDIQSHTHTHPNMSKLNEEELMIEITRSFETIENNLGVRDVRVMCYPEFKSSKQSRQENYDLGVQLQITDLATPWRLSNYPTQLRRIHVHNDLVGEALVRQIKTLTM